MGHVAGPMIGVEITSPPLPLTPMSILAKNHLVGVRLTASAMEVTTGKTLGLGPEIVAHIHRMATTHGRGTIIMLVPITVDHPVHIIGTIERIGHIAHHRVGDSLGHHIVVETTIGPHGILGPQIQMKGPK